jgi:hypothetical protein
MKPWQEKYLRCTQNLSVYDSFRTAIAVRKQIEKTVQKIFRIPHSFDLCSFDYDWNNADSRIGRSHNALTPITMVALPQVVSIQLIDAIKRDMTFF